MIFYYITNKDNAQLIKNEGLLECKRPLCLISQYNNNDIDLSTHEILKICIKDIKYNKICNDCKKCHTRCTNFQGYHVWCSGPGHPY